MNRHVIWPLALAVLFALGCGSEGERGKHKDDRDRPRQGPPPKDAGPGK